MMNRRAFLGVLVAVFAVPKREDLSMEMLRAIARNTGVPLHVLGIRRSAPISFPIHWHPGLNLAPRAGAGR
jgi:hypothetical protein